MIDRSRRISESRSGLGGMKRPDFAGNRGFGLERSEHNYNITFQAHLARGFGFQESLPLSEGYLHAA